MKIVELQSVTKASEDLHLTQPAVSIQLRKFQDQFSVPLTEVVGKRLFVTDFGREIALSAEKILNEVDAINYKTMTFKNQLAGRLRISVASTGKYVMPYFLAGFMQKHKGVDLVMDVTNKSLVVRSLEQNEVDFALVSVLPDRLKIESMELLENKLYLVGSPKLETNKKGSFKKLFEKHPLIYREPGSATRNAMQKFFDKHAIPPHKEIELTSNEAVKQAVVAGLGYSIMPLIGLKNVIKHKELEIIPVKGLPMVTHWNLTWLSSKKLSPVALAFLDYLSAEKTRIIDEEFSWYDQK